MKVHVLNTEKELFKIPEVRRALSLALDRTSMVSAISFGKVANSFVSAALAEKLYNGMSRPLSAEQDMIEAKNLIESVSAKLQGIDMSFTLSINNDKESIAIAEIAKNAWSELGFNVTVNVLELTKNTIVGEDQKIEITDSTVQYLAKNAAMGKVTNTTAPNGKSKMSPIALRSMPSAVNAPKKERCERLT